MHDGPRRWCTTHDTCRAWLQYRATWCLVYYRPRRRPPRYDQDLMNHCPRLVWKRILPRRKAVLRPRCWSSNRWWYYCSTSICICSSRTAADPHHCCPADTTTTRRTSSNHSPNASRRYHTSTRSRRAYRHERGSAFSARGEHAWRRPDWYCARRNHAAPGHRNANPNANAFHLHRVSVHLDRVQRWRWRGRRWWRLLMGSC
mmetsp:Transcript_15483/g.38355  ORF Transcript_15483/g.38355 Transcript_15483/m.38355 type:complete len:202 (-) Transcript_15483:261-866(-)